MTAVQRTLSILDVFLTQSPPIRLKDLEGATGLFHSVILRYMISLEGQHYVHRTADGIYMPGPRLYQLGKRYEEVFDLGAVVQPVLDVLVAAVGETASFYVRDQDLRVCLYRRDSAQPVRVAVRQGMSMPIEATASDQALCLLDGGRLLDDIRPADRICISSAVRDPWSCSMSTPVVDAEGSLAGALTLSGPVNRFNLHDPTARRLLSAQAQLISKQLGYGSVGRR